MEPSNARAFWFALVDNAARLVVDADTLGPESARAQSLVVLAMEELGKAQWVAQIFSWSWYSGDEAPLDVPHLDQFGASHRQKLMQSTHYSKGLQSPSPNCACPVLVRRQSSGPAPALATRTSTSITWRTRLMLTTRRSSAASTSISVTMALRSCRTRLTGRALLLKSGARRTL